MEAVDAAALASKPLAPERAPLLTDTQIDTWLRQPWHPVAGYHRPQLPQRPPNTCFVVSLLVARELTRQAAAAEAPTSSSSAQ